MRGWQASVSALCMAFVLCGAADDFQQWSEQSYMDEPYSLTCNDSMYPVFLNQDDQLTWRRHGHDGNIMDDDHFELSRESGIQNMRLTIKKVTDEMNGFYFCEIRDTSGAFVSRVVKGLNIGGHKYHDQFDKYRRPVIVGVISAASVLFIVVGTCVVDHFRYQSEDERRERREAKEDRVRRQREMKNGGGGHDNLAMDTTVSGNGSGKQDPFPSGYQKDFNTQL